MKWNILLGTVVLGFGLCTQSYGFELLDRMLGVGGGDCCQKDHVQDSKCGCDGKGHHQKGGLFGHTQKDGKCNGHDQKCDGKGHTQKCGCGLLGGHAQKGCDGKGHDQKCDGKGHEQKCGCGGGLFGHMQKNGCDKGHDQKCDGKGHEQKCGGGLFGHMQKCGCDGKGHHQKDGKGCEQKDGKCCAQKSAFCAPNLFGSLFACGKSKGKCKADTADDYKSDKVDDAKAPMPPAPVVDPSAYLQTRRPVVQASVELR